MYFIKPRTSKPFTAGHQQSSALHTAINYILLSSMKEARFNAAAAHHEDKGFLITGGWGSKDGSDPKNRLPSTEITKDGVTFEYFTPLPVAYQELCMVALNDEDDGDFFVAGGWDGGRDSIKRAFIHKGNQWNEITPMPTARRGKKPSLEM